MSLEAQRQLLEELNSLEAAAAQRFRRNPALRAAASIREADEVLENKPKRPHRETLSQQHELEYFKQQYALNTRRCRGSFSGALLAGEISKMKDPDLQFSHIVSTIQDIDAKYRGAASGNASSTIDNLSIYSSAPKEDVSARSKTGKVKRKYHLSVATQHIEAKLKQAFSETEAYGTHVDLTLFYEMYKSLPGSQQTYPEYLQTFLAWGTVGNKGPSYTRYLEGLLGYLQNFYKNAFPLGERGEGMEKAESESVNQVEKREKGEKKEAEAESAVKTKTDTGENSGTTQNTSTAGNGEVYCKACDRRFAKESVYNGHLAGRKHKKNAEKARVAPSEALPEQKQEPKGKPANNKDLENHIKAMAAKLSPILHSTISDYSRQSRFSDREQQLERIALEGELSDYTAVDSDSAAGESEDDDLEDAYSKDLPLGADGIPIPLWLYKLQGLHRSYVCEVCGNVSYKGRQQYNKHFGQAKHVHGLTCLGVSEQDTALFANISSIAEVEQLWEKIKMSKTAEQEDDENVVEVEDEEGNVMSRKDYEELKKQGLI